ncbi:MAG TPA: hypothetical protein VKA00_01820 [Trueperaceae bacterium]|nr:hypothetical protein [Trueperaceae bacterium]
MRGEIDIRFRVARLTLSRPALFVLLVLLSFPVGGAFAQSEVGVSPPRVVLTGRPGDSVSTTVSLLASGSADVTVDVSLSDWTLDPAGNLSFLQGGSTPYSASSWLALDSQQYSVSEGSATSVRLTARIPSDPGLQGSYRTAVLFASQQAEAPNSQVGVTMRARVGLIVYVVVDGTQRGAVALADFYQDGRALVLDVQSDRNTVARVSGEVQLRGADGKTIATIQVPDTPVLRGGERLIRLELPGDLAAGYYVALALVKPDGASTLAGQATVTVR